jgi:hypothetical protein
MRTLMAVLFLVGESDAGNLPRGEHVSELSRTLSTLTTEAANPEWARRTEVMLGDSYGQRCVVARPTPMPT